MADGKPGGPPPEAAPRELSVTYYPMTNVTLVAVFVRSRFGDRRWDRRDGTMSVDIGSAELEGLLPEQALRVLLRSTLRDL